MDYHQKSSESVTNSSQVRNLESKVGRMPNRSSNLSKLCMEDQENEEVRCIHGFVLPLMTSWTTRNPGRRYWVCPYYGGARSCDFWRWKDVEIDPRSKVVVPKLIERIGELEASLEAIGKLDNAKSSNNVGNTIEREDINKMNVDIEKLVAEIQKMKEKKKKWRTKLDRSKFRETILWAIIFCVCVVVISGSFQVMYL